MNDLISRQAAIDALKRISFSYYFECGEYLSEDTREIEIINSNKALEAIKALPSAQPNLQPTCNQLATDCISRQAAIDEIKRWIGYIDEDMILRIQTGLKKVPSAQRTGRWKVSNLPKGKMKYCSECGFGQYIADERQYGYCPNCGADMRGEEDE